MKLAILLFILLIMVGSTYGAINRTHIFVEKPLFISYASEPPELPVDPLEGRLPAAPPLLDIYTILWIAFMSIGYAATIVRSAR